MLDRADPSTVLVAHQQWIEKVARVTCGRNSVWGDEAEDFISLALMKVLENDYAVLRKFRGECDLKTYLAAVVQRRFQEYVRERWGRWRPSAKAEHLGQPAKDLEALVYRDGYSLKEAIEVLRTSGKTAASVGELTRLFAQLPQRTLHMKERGSATLKEELPAAETADAGILAREAAERCRRVMEALFCALASLDTEEQVLVRGRFSEGRSVADLARALHREQAPLYKESVRLLHRLRQAMEAAGVSKQDVDECLPYQDA